MCGSTRPQQNKFPQTNTFGKFLTTGSEYLDEYLWLVGLRVIGL